MIDIDFFKRYNDACGHQKGDECLKAVAEVIATEMQRASDHTARYGGEEFAVILPNTTSEGQGASPSGFARLWRNAVFPISIPRTAAISRSASERRPPSSLAGATRRA
jgi:diguanylate cyclase (GGDEF)-like protein